MWYSIFSKNRIPTTIVTLPIFCFLSSFLIPSCWWMLLGIPPFHQWAFVCLSQLGTKLVMLQLLYHQVADYIFVMQSYRIGGNCKNQCKKIVQRIKINSQFYIPLRRRNSFVVESWLVNFPRFAVRFVSHFYFGLINWWLMSSIHFIIKRVASTATWRISEPNCDFKQTTCRSLDQPSVQPDIWFVQHKHYD